MTAWAAVTGCGRGLAAATAPRRRALRRLARGSLAALAPAWLGACTATGRGGPMASLARLEAELARQAQAAGGTVGVALRHPASGLALASNAGERFPMASVFKLPLALQLLSLVETGRLSLDKRLAVTAADLRPGSGWLARAAARPAAMSVRELLEAMLLDSDNTATDLLWTEAGGAAAVNARLAALGHAAGISVDRPAAGVIAGAVGVESRRGDALTPGRLDELVRQTPRAERQAAARAFLEDRRDTATPAATADLLQSLWRGHALGADATALLLGIMKRCRTGTRRIRGGLPRGTVLAHKTGTLRPGATNDAGIVELPDGSVAVLVVMIRGSPLALEVQESTIAGIARAMYSYLSG